MTAVNGEPNFPSAFKVFVDVPSRYTALLKAARVEQLKRYAIDVGRLEGSYRDGIAALTKLLTDEAQDWEQRYLQESGYYETLIRNMDAVLIRLNNDQADGIEAGAHDLAQVACDAQVAASKLLEVALDQRLVASMHRTIVLSDGQSVAVSFGHVAEGAVNKAAARVWADGFKLSDRLGRLDAETRKIVNDTVVQGIASQTSAKKLADQLHSALMRPDADTPHYRAMRIARTEINIAHRQALVDSCLDPETRELKSYISAIGWRLSVSHKGADICDLLASDDSDGLGEGNYLPENVPDSHPNCLCFCISVLTDYPEVSAPSKAPDPDGVPQKVREAFNAESSARSAAGSGED